MSDGTLNMPTDYCCDSAVDSDRVSFCTCTTKFLSQIAGFIS